MAVIIKGKSISGGQKSRDHYLRGKENEQITVWGVRGFATQNADEALEMIEVSARGTKCKKPLYSVKISPETDRVWTKEEAIDAVLHLEHNLGLSGHPLVLVEHVKHGRTHYHALWDRRPPGGGPAKAMSNDYAIHQRTQRELEAGMGLKPMQAKGRDFKKWEVDYAKRHGYDIFKIRKDITTAHRMAKTGEGFKTLLSAHKITLCRGDKAQFVLVLPWGQHKALSSMILGRPKKAELRQWLADIDTATLPTIMEAKAKIKASLSYANPSGIGRKSGASVVSPKSTGFEGRQQLKRIEDLQATTGPHIAALKLENAVGQSEQKSWQNEAGRLPRTIQASPDRSHENQHVREGGDAPDALADELASIAHVVHQEYAPRIAAAQQERNWIAVDRLKREMLAKIRALQKAAKIAAQGRNARNRARHSRFWPTQG